MPSVDICSMIARDIAKALDEQLTSGRFDRELSQREGGEKISKEEGGMARTVSGWFMNDIGTPTVPYTIAERLSLKGNIAHKAGGGRELVGGIERYENVVDISARSNVVFVNEGIKSKGVSGANLHRLTPEEKINFTEVMEGRPSTLDEYGVYAYEPGSMPVAPMNEKVAQAATIMRRHMKDSQEQLEREQAAGFKPFHKPDYYWPIMHETNELRTNLKFRENSVQGLAKKIASNNGRNYILQEDITAAHDVFEHYINRQYAKTGANIQRERVWDVGAERIMDPLRVFELYEQQKQKIIHEKRIFGERNEEHGFPVSVSKLMGSIMSSNPGDSALVQRVQTLVQDTFGIVPRDATFNTALMRGLNGAQGLKLSLSVVQNASQFGNTWMATNGKSVLKAIYALARNSEVEMGMPARQLVGMMASVKDQALYEATLWNVSGVLGRSVEGLLKWTGFTGVEQFNRATAGLSGIYFAEQQAKMYVKTNAMRYRRQLIELGINPELAAENIKNTGALALEQKLLAGQKVINATQFRARQGDLPFFATNNPSMWRALLTFRTFSLNQVRLIKDLSAKRPGRTVLFGAAVMPVIGTGVNFMHDFLYDDVIGGVGRAITGAPKVERPEQDAMSQYLEAAASAGAFGWISNTMYAAYMSGENQNYKNFLTPSIISSAEDYFMMASQIVHGKWPQLARTAGQQFGGLGSAFARGMFPPDSY